MQNRIIIFLILFFSSAILSAQIAVIIGDSQSYWIAKSSKTAKLDSSICKSGIGLSGLNKLIIRNKKPNKQVLYVFISIGVNDNYNYTEVLFYQTLRRAYPYAQYFLIGGSWGWGNTKKYRPDYYKNFRGMKLLKHTIGKGDPHKDKPEYKQIASEIDSIVALN